MAESVTRDAREILERATELAASRRSQQVLPTDVLRATLQFPRSLADTEIKALGVDPNKILALIPADGAEAQPTLRQLLTNADREATVLGHYQVDSIHLLLAMLYTDSPATAVPLQRAGVTLYDLRAHVQTGSKAAVPDYSRPSRPDQGLRRRPWPSLRGVFSVSPIFLGVVGVLVLAGGALWSGQLSREVAALTTTFVVAGWITSLCLHEFGHALVAYLGGDRSIATRGYLSLNPLRYQNLLTSLILPTVFILLGGIALPGGAVYIDHSSLRTRAWSSAVSVAGVVGNLLFGLVIAAIFIFSTPSVMVARIDFYSALALLGFFEALAVVLNLIPVPGLDGFGIIRPWLPQSLQYAAARYSSYGVLLVFISLWFFPPARATFYDLTLQLTNLGGIPPLLIGLGQMNMRFI